VCVSKDLFNGVRIPDSPAGSHLLNQHGRVVAG
jgi:hypothetical protein